MRVFKLITTVLILGLLLAACSSDKKDNGTNQQEQPPEGLSIEPVQLPASMTQSSDQYAQTVVSYVNLINLFQYWTGNLMPRGQVGKVGLVESTTDGPPWVYTWTQQGVTAKLVIDIKDNQYHWVLTYSGTIEGYQYNNAKVLEAWEDMDGTSGKMVLYDPEDNSESAEWSWQKDENGTVTVNYKESSGSSEITVVQNADLSGSLEVYEDSKLTFKATWNADGSGTWWTYENGTQTGTGTWT